MKKFVRKVQHLGQKAAEIRQVLETVPPRVSEIRDAVFAVSGQVQKLRSDIVATVAPLRPENDAQLVTTLREIENSADILAEAGFDLRGVDLDVSAHRRLTVRLQRTEDVDAARLRSLLAVNSGRPVVKTLLTALLQADELSEKMELSRLRYTELVIDIGLVPSVRIGWRNEEVESRHEAEDASAATATGVRAEAASAPEIADPRANASMHTSFFDLRPRSTVLASAATVTSASSVSEVPAQPPVESVAAETDVRAAPETPAATPASWKSSALDRFKKMPDLTRRTR